MKESGYYPPGAEFDKNAPWNQGEPSEREFNVSISQTLSKSTTVSTNDYIIEGGELDPEDGGYWEDVNTSDTNWKKAYNNEHYTPIELIGALNELLDRPSVIDILGVRQHKILKEECSNWIEDETEVYEE